MAGYDRHKHVCELDCDGSKNLVITDPCYLFKGDTLEKAFQLLEGMGMVNGHMAPQQMRFDGLDMVVADTIFGDWSCCVNDRDNGKLLGTFTADAGCVCIVCLSDDEVRERLSRVPTSCRCVLGSFSGRARICHLNGRCWVEGEGVSSGSRVQFKSWM